MAEDWTERFKDGKRVELNPNFEVKCWFGWFVGIPLPTVRKRVTVKATGPFSLRSKTALGAASEFIIAAGGPNEWRVDWDGHVGVPGTDLLVQTNGANAITIWLEHEVTGD